MRGRAFVCRIALAMAFGVLVAQSVGATETLSVVSAKEEKSTFGMGNESVYAHSSLGTDVTTKGLLGVDFGGGYYMEPTFVQATFKYLRIPYGAARVSHPGTVAEANPLPADAEIGVPRTDASTFSLWSLGASAGAMFKLFKSESVVELAKVNFGWGFMNENDAASKNFQGPVVSIEGGVGYRIPSAIFSLTMGWSMAFMTRSGIVETAETSPVGQKKYLPLEWWTVQGGVMVFVF